MSSAEFKNVRTKMTKIVISTDMAHHNDHIRKMKELMRIDDFDIDDQKKMTICEHCGRILVPDFEVVKAL